MDLTWDYMVYIIWKELLHSTWSTIKQTCANIHAHGWARNTHARARARHSQLSLNWFISWKYYASKILWYPWPVLHFYFMGRCHVFVIRFTHTLPNIHCVVFRSLEYIFTLQQCVMYSVFISTKGLGKGVVIIMDLLLLYLDKPSKAILCQLMDIKYEWTFTSALWCVCALNGINVIQY